MRLSHLACLFTSTLVVLGCSSSPQDDVASLDDSLVVNNGITANGITINGITANGITANGITANGISINGWDYGGDTVSQVGVRDSVLYVMLRSGRILSGMDVEGLKLTLPSDNGPVRARIDDVSRDPKTGALQYLIVLQTKGRPSVCGINATTNQPATVIPLSGIYDNSTGAYTPNANAFTFACTNAALGKCVLWGYAPWQTQRECNSSGSCADRSLFYWHQACVHLVRADYCGDAVPHTRNGTSINIWDPMSIQTQAANTGWGLEAEWTADGAQCIRHTRWLKADTTGTMTDLAYVQQNCPERLAANNPAACELSTSNFLTNYGFNTDLSVRRLIRNESANNQ